MGIEPILTALRPSMMDEQRPQGNRPHPSSLLRLSDARLFALGRQGQREYHRLARQYDEFPVHAFQEIWQSASPLTLPLTIRCAIRRWIASRPELFVRPLLPSRLRRAPARQDRTSWRPESLAWQFLCDQSSLC